MVDRQDTVTLREITADTVRAICDLTVREDQRQFVAANATSIAQAYFEKKAWFRAIYADDTPVGFIMLYDDREKPEYFLWRLMIDHRYQRLGYGRKAMALLIELVKERPNATEFMTSIHVAEGSPQGFYESLGFTLTGDFEDGEALLRLPLK